MKIGIMTFHWATNYGAVLQAYCLQEYLHEQGHEVEIINYKPRNFDMGIFPFLKDPRNWGKARLYIRKLKKEKKLADFRNNYLKISERFFSYEELCSIGNQYDAIISGSDQVLNPSFAMNGDGRRVLTSSYFLRFADEKVKKIGYAVSFGCDKYPEPAASHAIQWINSFDSISVRETSGLDILSQLGYTKEAVLVPDPTIIYGRKIYDNLGININATRSTKACVYMIRKACKVSMPAIYIDDNNGPHSMEEWLQIIASSSCLITNSYHGMIMALLSHTPFVVVFEGQSALLMNNRMLTLLNRLNLNDRMTNRLNDIDKILSIGINWRGVDENIRAFAIVGEYYIKNNIIK